jgi:hypothetical protein
MSAEKIVKPKMSKKNFLEFWNKKNPAQYANIEQVEVCGCGYPNCMGWAVFKSGHSHSKFK